MSTHLLALLLSAAPAPVDFDTEVLPVLTKYGCNAAACHGAAAGRGGFKLSLFGGDVPADYDAIVRHLEGRRVNLAKPTESLLVLKPTEQLLHEGGERFSFESAEAQLLERWIAAGAKRLRARRLTGLEVTPPASVLKGAPSETQLKVVAQFDDGSTRDVTDLAVYTPADPAAITADSAGKLRVMRRGQHTIVVRFLSLVRTVQVIVPLTDDSIDVRTFVRQHWIDDEVNRKLATLGLVPAPPADDATLLRRVFLDLTGRLPAPSVAERYLADTDPQKFSKLIEQLLAGDECIEYWTFKLATLLRIQTKPGDKRGAEAFHQWVQHEFAADASWAEMARKMVTATGDSHEIGQANFYRIAMGPREQAEYVSEVLMGVRLRCANCHNHPLDRWTQDDYHGLATLFARVDQNRVVKLLARGEVTHPATGLPAAARIPGDRFLPDQGDRRVALADWLTDANNAYFAKAFANRIWKALMGRGLVEPTDDVRDTNPATHQQLLERLAAEFAETNFNIRSLIREIVSSAAYQRSRFASQPDQADDRFYSQALLRPLEAEVLADAIDDVTGVRTSYKGAPANARAVSLYDPKTPSLSLDVLGRCARADSCESAGSTAGGGLTTKLHLLNGPLINGKLAAFDGRLQQLVQEASDEAIIKQFYWRCFSRPPKANEMSFWSAEMSAVKGDQQRRAMLEDIVWSLLSCQEFVTQH